MIEGRIQTESYQNKNGDTVYTTDVVASRVEFLESRNAAQRSSEQKRQPAGRTDQRPASRQAETERRTCR
ncbi:single-stranded DNA-binding protein [Hornefia porci]|uniref:single-stranded DNA-binding protein n=1 Tax=Hornefia porci TaxID=2652292 RepID=UPI001FE25CC6|nr:single-stranded DNA-binding protein [Hornefia porci]